MQPCDADSFELSNGRRVPIEVRGYVPNISPQEINDALARQEERDRLDALATGVKTDSPHCVATESEFLWDRMLYWQRQLRLQDWDCTVELATRRELQEGSTATTRLNAALKKARIRILAPHEQEPPSERTSQHDLEQTLVHELLHIHFALWRGQAEVDDTPEYCAKETAINQIAEALVRSARGGERR